jgi:hypothetical protein
VRRNLGEEESGRGGIWERRNLGERRNLCIFPILGKAILKKISF